MQPRHFTASFLMYTFTLYMYKGVLGLDGIGPSAYYAGMCRRHLRLSAPASFFVTHQRFRLYRDPSSKVCARAFGIEETRVLD